MKKILFNATFEQSLNLSDDPFVDFMNKDVNNLADPKVEKKPILIVIGLLFIIFLVGIIFLIAVLSTKGSMGNLGESTVPIPDINFLSMWVFYLLLFIWGVLVEIFRNRGEYFFNKNTWSI